MIWYLDCRVQRVREVLDRAGWESERFRAYRARVEYPILHAQIMLSFDLPAAP